MINKQSNKGYIFQEFNMSCPSYHSVKISLHQREKDSYFDESSIFVLF